MLLLAAEFGWLFFVNDNRYHLNRQVRDYRSWNETGMVSSNSLSFIP